MPSWLLRFPNLIDQTLDLSLDLYRFIPLSTGQCLSKSNQILLDPGEYL